MFMDKSILTYLNIAIVIAVLIWFLYELSQFFRRKKAGSDLTADEFKKDMRRAQIIDLREKDDFNAGRILGARNIPFLQFKQRLNEIRRDQPIYLYDDNETFSRRASLVLKKEGFTEIYRLKGGYADWDGKIKKSKY